MKRYILKILFYLNQFGFDPLRLLRSLRGVPQFVSDWWSFRKRFSGAMIFMPCLHDRYDEAGVAKSEYFWQDLMVARWIHAATPARHVDIGSRVDGFVAHVASFREIEVFDVRPLSCSIPGVTFTQADLMNVESIMPLVVDNGGYCDSISCLHALEHFGLGRYGDPVDPSGYRKGLRNMASLLYPGGTLYLSVPVGKERVEFNANWVFDPRQIVSEAQSVGLTLRSLSIFNAKKGLQNSTFEVEALKDLAEQPYSLGIFRFTRV